MSEPNSVLVCKDLITKIAQEAGIAYYGSTGQGKAMPPVDIHDLELCKEIMNDAIRMFIADAPPTGWRWRRRIMSVALASVRVTGVADAADTTYITDLTLATTYDADNDLNNYYVYVTAGTGKGSYAKITDYTALTGRIDVAAWLKSDGTSGGTTPIATDEFAITDVETVGGDSSRYVLAEDFGGEITGPIKYAKSSGLSARIDWTDEACIRDRQAMSVMSGNPHLAAIRVLEPVTGTLGPKRRYELLLDTYAQGKTVEFPYVVTFNKLDIETGLATGGSTTTIVDSARTEGNEYFVGWKIEIISGTGKGSWAIAVTPYTGSSGTFTVADWLKADGSAGGTDPAANSVYVATPVNNLHPAGAAFDQAILSACMAQKELMVDEQPTGLFEKYTKKDLPQAYLVNDRQAPKSVGSLANSSRVRPYRDNNTITFS